MYSYLPRLKRWVVNRAMMYARCDHGMATIGDKIFCIGGRTLNAVRPQQTHPSQEKFKETCTEKNMQAAIAVTLEMIAAWPWL